jgi:hypothetical protein
MTPKVTANSTKPNTWIAELVNSNVMTYRFSVCEYYSYTDNFDSIGLPLKAFNHLLG